MTNQEMAAVFDEVADLLEFQGANPFRVRAYRNAARKIGDLSERITDIAADPARNLSDLEGIGKDLAEKLQQLATTGKLRQLEELQQQVPASVLAIMRVPTLGPKKAAALFKELGVETLEQLRAACEKQQVRELKGFGAKTEELILKGLEIAGQADKRTRWKDADAIVQAVLAHMQDVKDIKRIEPAGSYRRRCDTVGDLDFLVEAKNVDKVMDQFGSFESVAEVIARGETKMSVRLKTGMQMDLRVVPAESFGAALQYFTGSKNHNVVLRSRAKQKGLKISEWGVFQTNKKGEEKYLVGKTEKEVYEALQLPLFPPELREAREEFEWAKQGELPQLLELKDIRGDLHMHTNATDGKASLEEMIEAARARGHQYIAITDHSQRVTMASGLHGPRLLAQWAEIDRLRERYSDIHILKGLECDILEKGGMDLPDEILEQGDWIIGSVHYGQNQPRAQITKRIIGALENPYVDIIAHPTGRLINRRDPYEVDMDEVFQAAKANKKMLELNANPARLDLHDIHCATAKRLGIKVVISTDAHSIDGLDVMRYGVLQARRGGLTAADVANTFTWNKFSKLLRKK